MRAIEAVTFSRFFGDGHGICCDMSSPDQCDVPRRVAPISTITWFVDIFSDRISGAGWHLMHVEAETIADGYSSQRMVLWDATGAPVLIARQNIAIFG